MNNKRIILILALLAIILLLAIFFQTKKKRFDWRETYEMESEEPYGTFIIKELLTSYFPEHPLQVLQDSIAGELPQMIEEKSNYIFIGEGLYMDSADVQSLLKFVEIGNNAFLSSRTIPYDLMFYVYYEECDNIAWDDYSTTIDSLAKMNFLHPKLNPQDSFSYKYFYRNKVKPYRWQYIDDFYFCEGAFNLQPLGTMNEGLANFASIQYGKGTFFLHTTPLVFSNFHLLKEQNLQYASNVFAHLAEGPIYWDEYSKISEALGRRRNEANSYYSQRRLSSKSPLQYILEQPPLAWAWYILLGMGLLYLIFRAKRQQRVIPVLEKNTNTSLEFISTIGSLYFIQNNHRKLCLQKIKLFQGFLRDRYNLPIRELDKDMTQRLAVISEVPEALIDKILTLEKNIRTSDFVSENTLIDFHKLIDTFYKTCK